MFRQLLRELKRLDEGKNLAEVEWSKLCQQALKLYYQGDLDLAVPFAEQALEIARSIFPSKDNNLVGSINNLAELYKSLGRLEQTAPLYEEILDIYRCLFGESDNTALASILNNLALVYQHQGRLLYVDRGKLAAAQLLYEEALKICQELPENFNNTNLVSVINNLAQLCQYQGNLAGAELMFFTALEMRRQFFGNRDHNDLATSINNLADLYYAQGQLSKAEILFLEALEMCRQLFGNRDHNDLASSISNLAPLYQSQGKSSAAESLLEEALDMRRRLFTDRDNQDLALSINNLADFHMAQKQPEKAFILRLDAMDVEENTLRHWFSYSTELNRINFVEINQINLKVLVSLLCQYFPDDSEKIAQVAIAIARRKAFAAQAEVELNYLRYSDRYPDLAADFQDLATAQGKLTHLNHTYYHHQGAMDDAAMESHQQAKQTLTEQIDRLERKLSANVPELRQLQQHVTLPAIFAALPEHSCAIEFYHFDVYNFGANGWQAPQYVAFILAPGGNVRLVQLGDAREIDELINNYRDLSRDANLPSFGARPNPSIQQPKPVSEVEELAIDLQLSQRLLTPILESIDLEIKQLIFIPDGALHTLPIGNLLVGQETRLFGKVGFLGASLGDRFVCTYLSTLREILTRADRPNRQLSAPIAIGNPNYDYPDVPTSPALAGTGVSTLRSMMSQVDSAFKSIPESQLLLDRLKLQLAPDARFFTQDAATETVLRDAKSPKLLVIITHGYLLDEERDRIQLIFKLLECSEGEELDLIQTYQHLVDLKFVILLNAIGDWLDTWSTNGGNFCRSLGEFIQTEFPELVDREPVHSIDPMQNHGLALTGANSWLAGEKLSAEIGKGFLLARDVAYLDLFGTEIVFLIACSSGLGDVKTGEGVFGLRRAFAIAGVKQLITSLWDVPTHPTMLLTDKFFEEYDRGIAPSIALQTAQNYVRDISRTDLASTPLGEEILDELERHSIRIADPKYPLRHPYFWGAWICQGV